MNALYRVDERVIQDLVSKHVKPKENVKLKLNIYYRSRTTSNLIMKNNPNKTPKLQLTNVVYEYQCNHEDCKLRSPKVNYIGHTTTTLSRRLTCHLQSGALQQHHQEVHQQPISREELVDGTNIITEERSRRRLRVLEAVLIRERLPTLNTQRDCQGILTLCDSFPGLRPGN